eukprot:symbB.v1.2.016321.t1/scaffold1240.1/size129799/4
MSLYGASYGTTVVSVYASIFPHRTYRLVMDGVVNPTPDVHARADSSARGIEAVWDGLVRDCETSLVRKMSADEVCPAAPSTSSKTMKVLKGANRSEAAALLHIIYVTVFKYQETLGPVAMACIEQFYSRKEVEGCNKTLELERNLTARKNKSQDANESDHFGIGIQALVMGTDSAGRANEEEFITWWKQTKESDPIGVKWATTWMVAMSTWPAYARPVPPVGDPELQAVIIGNLHDPNTAYENAQTMAQAFPQGYLVTWQGYGHCLKVLKHATALLKAYNASKKSETLPEYTNAVAKYACMSKILSYLDTGILKGQLVLSFGSTPAQKAKSYIPLSFASTFFGTGFLSSWLSFSGWFPTSAVFAGEARICPANFGGVLIFVDGERFPEDSNQEKRLQTYPASIVVGPMPAGGHSSFFPVPAASTSFAARVQNNPIDLLQPRTLGTEARRGFAGYLVFACYPHRERFFAMLDAAAQAAGVGRVETLSRCGNSDPDTTHRKSKRYSSSYYDDAVEIFRDFRFAMKIVNAFLSGAIPIYWGTPYVTQMFNPKAFIYVNHFKSFEAAVEYIIQVAKDPQLFAELATAPILRNSTSARWPFSWHRQAPPLDQTSLREALASMALDKHYLSLEEQGRGTANEYRLFQFSNLFAFDPLQARPFSNVVDPAMPNSAKPENGKEKAPRAIRLGDTVFLRSLSGKYLDVDGDDIHARKRSGLQHQRFVVCPYLNSQAPDMAEEPFPKRKLANTVTFKGVAVRDGDAICLMACNGYFLGITDGITGEDTEEPNGRCVVKVDFPASAPPCAMVVRTAKPKEQVLDGRGIYLQSLASAQLLCVDENDVVKMEHKQPPGELRHIGFQEHHQLLIQALPKPRRWKVDSISLEGSFLRWPEVGVRVRQATDGSRKFGMTVEHDTKSGEDVVGWVKVKWDHGAEENCRVGAEGCYDLLVISLPSFTATGAGGVGKDCNGHYIRVGTHNGMPKYRLDHGDAIMFFEDDGWKMNSEDDTRQWCYQHLEASARYPPLGRWSIAFGGPDASPSPNVTDNAAKATATEAIPPSRPSTSPKVTRRRPASPQKSAEKAQKQDSAT